MKDYSCDIHSRRRERIAVASIEYQKLINRDKQNAVNYSPRYFDGSTLHRPYRISLSFDESGYDRPTRGRVGAVANDDRRIRYSTRRAASELHGEDKFHTAKGNRPMRVRPLRINLPGRNFSASRRCV